MSKKDFTFNITLDELKEATKFAKKHGTSYGTITMMVSNNNGIGSTLEVKSLDSKKKKDITDFGSW